MDAGEAERVDRAKRDLGLKELAPAGAPAQAAAKPAPKAPPALKKEESARADAASAPTQGAPVSVFGATPPAPQQAVRTGKPSMQINQGTTAAAQPRPEAAEAAPQVQAAPTPPEAMKPAPEAMKPAPAANSMYSRSTISGASLDTANAKAAERSPQSWIEDIRKLVKEGKSEEAGAQIAEFKKRYPDYALPEDLR